MFSYEFLLTDEAVLYAFRQLAQRVGIATDGLSGNGFEKLGISVHYGYPGQISLERPTIVVAPCAGEDWHRLLVKKQKSLSWLSADKVLPRENSLPFDDSIPVLFWGARFKDGDQLFAELRSDGTLIFYADIIAATFFMLSRWEETVVPDRDEHGRFPATASVAYKQGFLDRPIVDEYALILREWLKVLLPGWQPKTRSFSIKVSHDIDYIRRFATWRKGLRTVGGDLLKRRNLKNAWEHCVEVALQTLSPSQTGYFQGIYSLAKISREYGIGDDAFYFMTAEPGPLENEYTLSSPLMRRCLRDLQEKGFEIGLHPGYHTLGNPERLAEEKARMDTFLGTTQYGGRQHYLRFQVPNTWRHWEQVGLTYDSTMIYADHEGFRCGTCHPFRPFDVEQNRELNLLEYPLIVMDGTLRDYRGLTPEQGKASILELAQRCKQVEGIFTLLWHNSSLGGEWKPWFQMYQNCLADLTNSLE